MIGFSVESEELMRILTVKAIAYNWFEDLIRLVVIMAIIYD